jgi:hypothetical protein
VLSRLCENLRAGVDVDEVQRRGELQEDAVAAAELGEIGA